jgi:hypothetical protein
MTTAGNPVHALLACRTTCGSSRNCINRAFVCSTTIRCQEHLLTLGMALGVITVARMGCAR